MSSWRSTIIKFRAYAHVTPDALKAAWHRVRKDVWKDAEPESDVRKQFELWMKIKDDRDPAFRGWDAEMLGLRARVAADYKRFLGIMAANDHANEIESSGATADANDERSEDVEDVDVISTARRGKRAHMDREAQQKRQRLASLIVGERPASDNSISDGDLVRLVVKLKPHPNGWTRVRLAVQEEHGPSTLTNEELRKRFKHLVKELADPAIPPQRLPLRRTLQEYCRSSDFKSRSMEEFLRATATGPSRPPPGRVLQSSSPETLIAAHEKQNNV